MLVARLRAVGQRVLGKGSITVVFDARGEWSTSSESRGVIKIVYAPDADTEIVKRCLRAGRNVTVVTDDMRLRARLSQDVGRHIVCIHTSIIFDEPRRGVANAAKGSSSAGAKSAGANPSQSGRRPGSVEDEGLPPKSRDITRELERLWLDEHE